MRKLLLLVVLMCSGCWQALGTTDVKCWYLDSRVPQNMNTPWYHLVGLKDKWHSDVHTAEFQSREEAEAYIASHNLLLCGTK